MHSGLGAESAVVRVLMPGEAFAALEEPRKVSGGEQINVYKVRTIKDNKEGWVTNSTTELQVKPWSRRYKVLKPVPLTGGLLANEAAEVVEVLRLLETDELLDIAEHPTPDSSSGLLRLRCMAVRDKLVGWASIRDSVGGELNVRPVAAGEEGALPVVQFAQVEPEQDEKKPHTVKPPLKAAGTVGGKRPAAFQDGQHRPPAGYRQFVNAGQPRMAAQSPHFQGFDGGYPAKRWKGSGKGGAWAKW